VWRRRFFAGWTSLRLYGPRQQNQTRDRLSDAFRTADGREAAVAYAQSYVGTRVIAQRLGANFPVFLQYVSNGTPMDQALLLFNVSAADVERAWARPARTR
jgi:hypothetical protein